MKLKITLLAAFFFGLAISALQAQVSKDATVPLSATIATGPASITLNWPNPGNANILILRRTKGQAGNAWVLVVNVAASNLTSLIDNGVAAGQTYEYVIQRTLNGINAFGYVHVALNVNAINSRGKILIFVDSTTADALGVELVRLKNDMRGDGWWPIPFHTGPSSTVQSIKNQIMASYAADPVNVKSVLLIGSVPIPYSGDTNWDGHPEHMGAWPSDAFYADVNGIWTDTAVNNVTPARTANVNVPGDGKFDQSYLPSAAELQVGRIDFRRLNAPAFGATNTTALIKRYLDKNHKWRIGQYTVANKALVDDNFGYFGGEAFAANGFRNAYPLVGEANVVEADFFNDTDTQSFLLGYGTGPGTYTSAGGVGSSANFATDSVNIVFSNLFGSYHGDWDYESDPFMPSALASRGGILTCAWAGRPHYFNQYLASGETIGYCTWETMNAQFNNGFFGSFGESGAHVSLLGDPTLRAHVVKPITNLTAAASGCSSVALNWTASPDAVTGYHVYRAFSQDGAYTRLTTTPITATTFNDNAAIADTLYYQVRAIKNVSTPGGGTYANNSVGPIFQLVFVPAGGPVVTATGGSLTCAAFSVTLTASPSLPVTTWNWTGPNNFSSSQQNPTVTVAGTYTVTATAANGCSGTATAVVIVDASAPTVVATVSNVINCANASATITVNPAGLASATITGPNGFFVTGFSAVTTQAGNYNVTAISSTNGCQGNTAVTVVSDMLFPSVATTNNGPLTCTNTVVQLSATSNLPGVTFAWSGPCLNGSIATCPGVYTVTVTNSANGCSTTASTIVTQDIQPPNVSTQGQVITCNNPTVVLTALVGPNVSTQWSGPCLVSNNPPTASCAGVYTVVATNMVNGCSNSATAIVTEDVVSPSISGLPTGATLTCASPCVNLIVPNLPGLEILFNGQVVPPGFPIQLCQSGVFQLEVRNINNGCTSPYNFIVSEDFAAPLADAGPDKQLTCSAQSVTLDGSASSSNATFSWIGPNGFTSTLLNPTVSVVGTYILLVTNSSNGCVNSDQVLVTIDGILPLITPGVNGQITCAAPSVVITSGNISPNYTYAWTGPNGFTSNEPTPIVTVAGVYTVVVSTASGCTNSGQVAVTANTQAPDLFVLDPVLTCNHPCAIIFLEEGNEVAEYTTLCNPGVYNLVATGINGCTAAETFTLTSPPLLSVSFDPLVFNCNTTSLAICAMVTGGTPPYSYLWSNGQTSQCTTVNTPGLIAVTVKDAAECTANIEVVVTQPPAIVLSGVIVNESAPNAHNGAIDVTVSGGNGQFVYQWSNGALTQDISNLAGGTYTVTVTDAVSGCTQTQTYVVTTPVGTDEAAIFQELLLSPNPTTGISLLSAKLFKPASWRIEVRDAAGRLVLQSPDYHGAEVHFPIDLTTAPAGMYSLALEIDGQVFVRQLAVVR